MSTKQREIRTKNAGLKIGEVTLVDNQLGAIVKQGKKKDIITINEFASQIYGMEVRCEITPV